MNKEDLLEYLNSKISGHSELFADFCVVPKSKTGKCLNGNVTHFKREGVMKFTKEQNKIWAKLFANQLPRAKKYACEDFLTGLDILDLPPDRIPSLEELNEKITPRTGWKTVRTAVRYTDAAPWYMNHFLKKEFLITDYMRSWEELEFTPEPDMFHDIFGHMPFMVYPHYTALQDMFAPPFLRANKEQQENIKRLAWFSTEFGLIMEKGTMKIFGSGIISSKNETDKVMGGGTVIQPFKIENILKRDKAIYTFNEVLFIFDSIDELKEELASYFDSV